MSKDEESSSDYSKDKESSSDYYPESEEEPKSMNSEFTFAISR
jgi:hypothetical protein